MAKSLLVAAGMTACLIAGPASAFEVCSKAADALQLAQDDRSKKQSARSDAGAEPAKKGERERTIVNATTQQKHSIGGAKLQKEAND